MSSRVETCAGLYSYQSVSVATDDVFTPGISRTQDFASVVRKPR